jgi:hypothetical protein
MSNAEQAHLPNPYPLSLGLLTHPDRQRSGIGDAGRSAIQYLANVLLPFPSLPIPFTRVST